MTFAALPFTERNSLIVLFHLRSIVGPEVKDLSVTG